MAGEFAKVTGWVKQHPYVTAGAVFASGAVLIYLYYAGGSTAQPQSSGATAQAAAYAAEVQAQVQQEALQAQYGAQLSAQQTAAGIATTQYGDQLAAVQSNNATQLGIAQLGAQTSQAGIAAQQAVQTAGIAAQTTLGAISAQTTDFALSQETSAAWDQIFGNLYANYQAASSPTAVATAQLISKISPTVTSTASPAAAT